MAKLVFYEDNIYVSFILKYIKNIYIVIRSAHQITENIVFIWIINGREIIKYTAYAKLVSASMTICAVVCLSRPINQIIENIKYM